MIDTTEIPARLIGKRQHAGLVVPYIQVWLADGTPDFRSTHESRRQDCLRRRLCGMCGESLEYRIVFLQEGEDRRQFTEPALHPECADYAQVTCPMVAGRMDRHPDRAVKANTARGQACLDPDCGCGGWVPNEPQGIKVNLHPKQVRLTRQTWYRYETRGYRLRVDSRGVLVAQASPPTAVLVIA